LGKDRGASKKPLRRNENNESFLKTLREAFEQKNRSKHNEGNPAAQNLKGEERAPFSPSLPRNENRGVLQ